MEKDNIAQLSPHPALQKLLVLKEADVCSDGANKFTAPLGTNQRSLTKVIGTFCPLPIVPFQSLYNHCLASGIELINND